VKPTYKPLVLFTLLVMILSQYSPASAASIFKFRGLGANASFSSIEGCIQTNVDVFTAEATIQVPPGRGSPFSSVNIYISQRDLCNNTQLLLAEGVTDLAEPELQISSKLISATLNTQVSMQDYLTGNVFDVTIDLAWTGVVPVTREHYNIHYGDKACKVYDRGTAVFRGSEAIATVSDGTTIFTPEPSAGAVLIRSNSANMSIGCT
jgi:hypothetical protein